MINKNLLEQTVEKLLTKGKGIFAADESNGTADKRLISYGAETGEEMRRKYRELFLCMNGIEKYVSGVILYDETFWQEDCSGVLFSKSLIDNGVIPGVKVDTGAKESSEFPGERITGGLETLDERLPKYFDGGARFTKWRVIVQIDEENGLPTENAINMNMTRLAEYSAKVQANGMVPIVEPEVVLKGKHTIEKSEEILGKVLKSLVSELNRLDVYLPGVILKTSMVINGDQNVDEASAEEVAEATIRVLKENIPAEFGGVVFLSGGQTAVEATAHLNAMAEKEPLPWEIAFSYGRALQGPALKVWSGKDENIKPAQAEFIDRLKMNHLADLGEYDIDLEFED